MTQQLEGPTEAPSATPSTAEHPLRRALLLWFYVWVLTGVVALAGAMIPLPFTSPAAQSMTWIVLYWVAHVALVAAFVFPDAEARRVFGRARPRAVEFCVLVGTVGGLVLWLIGALLPSYPWVSIEKQAGWPFAAALITGAVVPALFEEWMFRGLLQQRLSQVLSLRMAICVQAMMFAVAHMDDLDLLSLFAFGLLTGVLRVAAGALWPCMALHFIWNAASYALDYQIL